MDDDTRYDHLPLLGSGRFGKVYAQGDKALKFVKSSRTEFGVHDEIIREATIAGQIRFFQQKGVEDRPCCGIPRASLTGTTGLSNSY